MSKMKQYGEEMAELVESTDSLRKLEILVKWRNQLGESYDMTRLLMDGTFWSAVYGPITKHGEETRLTNNLFAMGLRYLRTNSPDDALEVEQALGLV